MRMSEKQGERYREKEESCNNGERGDESMEEEKKEEKQRK